MSGLVSMVRLAYKVALADLVLLAALYFVLQDLAWRAYYAGTPHAAVPGYVPSDTYSIFTRFFTMAGSGVSLTSPPTLDWVQLLVVALVALNGWFAYRAYSLKPRQVAVAAQTPTG